LRERNFYKNKNRLKQVLESIFLPICGGVGDEKVGDGF
jgi:hypothetical protein